MKYVFELFIIILCKRWQVDDFAKKFIRVVGNLKKFTIDIDTFSADGRGDDWNTKGEGFKNFNPSTGAGKDWSHQNIDLFEEFRDVFNST